MRLATDTGGTFTDLVVEDDDGSISLYGHRHESCCKESCAENFHYWSSRF